MLKLLRTHHRLNQRGMAVLEMVPVLIVLMVLLRYTYGFFGVIHTATIQSIAVRNYTMESFRHRARLGYLREWPTASDDKYKYKLGMRLHGIADQSTAGAKDPDWNVETRNISFPSIGPNLVGPTSFESRKAQVKNINSEKRVTGIDGANPVWMTIRYGMCIDFGCRDNN